MFVAEYWEFEFIKLFLELQYTLKRMLPEHRIHQVPDSH